MSALEAGQRVGPYVVETLLGMGGMGEVYRARDDRLGRRVALKVVRTDREDKTGVAPDDRLIAEARAVAALRHPNVVEIFDAGFDAGRTYVAMEFIEGKPLRAYVGDLLVPLATRKRWVLQIGAALAAAHRAGLIHRDVKPENVLVDAAGSARVLDFGLAKRVSSDTSAPTADAAPETIAGRVVGTVSYMAPEQLAGGKPDPKWDQFAWGLVAYELLTGLHPRLTVPMPGPTAHLTQTPKMANEVAPEISFGDAATLLTAIARDPARRFQSMDAAIAALRDEPTTAPAPARAETTHVEAAKSSSRTRAVAPPAAPKRWPTAVAIVLAAGGGVVIGRAMQKNAVPSPPSKSIASATASSGPPPAPSATTAMRAPIAPSSSVAPVATSTAPHEGLPPGWMHHCMCVAQGGGLCPFEARLTTKTCTCRDASGSSLDNDAGDYHVSGLHVADGQPCSGVDSNGTFGTGQLDDCAFDCEPRAFTGLHRTICHGNSPWDGKPREGLLFCY